MWWNHILSAHRKSLLSTSNTHCGAQSGQQHFHDVQLLERRLYLTSATDNTSGIAVLDAFNNAALHAAHVIRQRTSPLSTSLRSDGWKNAPQHHATQSHAAKGNGRPHNIHVARPHVTPKPAHKPKPGHKPANNGSTNVAVPNSAGSGADAAVSTAASVASGIPAPDTMPGYSDSQYSVVVQKDGRIVVLGAHDGTFSVVRYNSDGTLDATFGTSGIATVTFDAGKDAAHALAIDYAGTPQSNADYGKIVVAGGSTGGVVIARLNPDGSLDASFGTQGKLGGVLSGGSANALILEAGGKILVGGSGADKQPVVVRLSGKGAVDTTFANKGLYQGPITDLNGSSAVGVAQPLAVHPASKRGGIIMHALSCGCGGGGGYSAPSISLSSGSGYNATEGSSFDITGSVTDPNPSRSFSAQVDFGDGSSWHGFSVDPSSGNFDINYTYAEDSGTPHNVTISVMDTNDSEAGGANTTVAVSEPSLSPSVNINGTNPHVTEGQTYTATGSFSCADTDGSFSATVDYGDGSGGHTLPLSGNTFSLSHVYPEDGTYSVTVTVTDTDDGSSGSGSGNKTVTVAEAKPIISGSYHVAAGSTYTLSLTNSNPSETLGGWSIDWGDGSPLSSAAGSATSITHVFQDAAATDVITATASDDGTNVASNPLPIAVDQTTTSDAPATNINVMFQPWSRFYAGYMEDFGLRFGDHSDIYSPTTHYDYGWMKDANATAVSRPQVDAPGYDSFIPLPQPDSDGSPQNQWSIGLPNGTYSVTIVSGDPNVSGGAFYQTFANGTQVTAAAASGGSGRWVTATANVAVGNGWLSVYSGPSAVANVINMISVTPTTHIGFLPTSAPTNLTAYAESNSSINLNWTDNSDNETSFKIQRSTTSGSGYTTVGTTAADATYFADTGLSAGTTYYYRVLPSNSAGDGSFASASAVTLASNAETPYKGTAWPVASTGTSTIQAEDYDTGGQNVGIHTNTSFNSGGRYRLGGAGIETGGPVEQGYYLGWNVSGNWYNYTINVATGGYYRLDARVASEGLGGTFAITLDGNSLSGTRAIPDTGGWNAFQTLAVDNVYLPSGLHKLTLKDTSVSNPAEGNYDWFAFTPEATVPAPPLNLYAAATADSTVKLSWTDDTSAATGYSVLRATPGGAFSAIASLSAGSTSYSDTSASAGTTYLYEIQATNAQTPPTPPLTSNQATVRTPAATAASLAAIADANVSSSHPGTNYGNPATLQTSSTDQQIFLTFDLSHFGSSVNAAKLRLFGSVPSDQSGVTVAVYSLSSPPPTWTESGLTFSNEPLCNAIPLSTQSVNTGTARWYEWDITSYVNAQLTIGGSHKVIGVMLQASSPAGAPVSFNSRSAAVNAPALLVSTGSAVFPSAPSGLTATAISSSQINLAWTDNPPAATSIYIENSTDGTTWNPVASAAGTATSYPVTGLSPNQLYYFRVYAQIGSIPSADSNIAQATTQATVASISGAVYNIRPTPPATTNNEAVTLYNVVPNQPNGLPGLYGAGGVDYYAPDNSYLVAQVGLQEVFRDGTSRPFYTGASFGDESSVVVAQPANTGGFSSGDVFYADGASVVKLSGGTPTMHFAVPSFGDDITALTFDTTGIFGDDLVAVTTGGSVWLIDHLGNAAQLAHNLGAVSGGDNYESVTVLPDDDKSKALFGPFAGRIVVAQSDFFGIGRDGSVVEKAGPVDAAPDWEDMQLIPANENFFAINDGFLVGAKASNFADYAGQLLGVTESSKMIGTFRFNTAADRWQSSFLPLDPGGFNGPGWERLGFGGAGIGANVPPTDEPLTGWTVYLDANNNGTLDSGELSTTTTAGGAYSFPSVTPGTYHVREVVQSGWTQDTPATGVQTIVVGTGQPFADVDFGNHKSVPQVPVDSPPIIASSPTSLVTNTAIGNSAQTYTVSVTDADGDPLTYTLSEHPDWVTLSNSGSTYTITVSPPASFAKWQQDNPVVLMVDDGRGGVAVQPFTIELGGTATIPPTPALDSAVAQSATDVLLQWRTPAGVNTPTSYLVWWGPTKDTQNYIPADGDFAYFTTVPAAPGLPGTAQSYGVTTHLTGANVYSFSIVSVYSGLQSYPSNYISTETWVDPTNRIAIRNIGLGTTPPTEGTTYTGTVAAFLDQSFPADPSTAYTATINWGDGTGNSTGTLASAGSSWWNVNSSHAYAQAGTYTVTVTVTDTPHPVTVSTSGPAQVSDAPLTFIPVDPSGAAFTQYSGVSTSLVLGKFTDPYANSSPTDFLAKIEWGDGSWSDATITKSSGTYSVTSKDSYAYRRHGSFNAEVWVQDGHSQPVHGDPMEIDVQPATFNQPAPSDLSAYPVSQSIIELSWTNVPGVTGYRVIRYKGSLSDPSPVSIYPDAPDQTGQIPYLASGPYDDRGLDANTTYYYKIASLSADDIPSWATYTVSMATKAPAPTPTGVSAVALNSSTVEVSWTDGTPTTNSAQLAGYEVYRSTDNSNPAQLDMGLYASNTFFDDGQSTGLQASTTYYYTIVPVAALTGEKGTATTVSVFTGTGSSEVLPPSPTGFVAKFVGTYTVSGSADDRVDLSWGEAGMGDTFDGFSVYRSADPGFLNSALIGFTKGNRYVDHVNPANYGGSLTYYYRVKAVFENGLGQQVSSAAATASVNFAAGPATAVAPAAPTLTLEQTSNNGTGDTTAKSSYTGAVIVSWAEPAANTEGEFDVYRVPAGNSFTGAIPIGIVAATVDTFTDHTALPATSYWYKVVAVNPGGSASSSVGAVKTPVGSLPAPTGVTAASSYTTLWKATVTWSYNWDGSPPSRYLVYRRTATTGDVLVGAAATTSITDDNGGVGLDPNTTYYYLVRAVDANGNFSPASSEGSLVVSNNLSTPRVPIIAMTSPTPSSAPWNVGIDTPVYGVIEDQAADTSLTWSLTLRPVAMGNASAQDIVIASGTSQVGSIAGGGAVLANLDPTRFVTGAYNLILTASDGAGSASAVTQLVQLSSAFKLGNFALPVKDLTLQIPGSSPLVVQRTYDSQRTNVNSPDFGYGWQFNSWDVNLSTTATSAGFTFGDVVYITLPGGEQHSFAFEPYLSATGQTSWTGQKGGVNTYLPQFVATDGSGATLAVPTLIENDGAANGTTITLQTDKNGVYIDGKTLAPYNPANSFFAGTGSGQGYLLTTRDNRSYRVDSTAGTLITYTDLQGNLYTFPAASTRAASGTSYVTYTPVSGSASNLLAITRSVVNGQHPITQIADARSGATQLCNYYYDSNGNLTAAVDGVGNATSYAVGGELVAPNVTGTSGRTVYAVITAVIGGLTKYWNSSTNSFETNTSGHWGNYALPMSASGTSSAWFSVAMPAGVATYPGVTTVNATYYKTAVSGSPATGDATVIAQANLIPAGAVPSSSHSGNSFITTVLDGSGVPTIQATYNPSTRQMSALGDALGNKSPLAFTDFDGTTALQDGQDLTPPSGATPSTGDTQTIYDRQGDVVRTIQALKDPTTGSPTGYLVTVHEYPLAADNINGETDSTPADQSNQNAIVTATDWQPFTISGTDSSGLRYTQRPQDLTLPSGYTTWPHTVTGQGLLDPSSNSTPPGAFRATSKAQYLGDGLVLNTSMSYAVATDGSNDIIETTTDPYGNITVNTYDPTMTFLLTSTNALGETTTNTYSTAGALLSTFNAEGTLVRNTTYAGTESGGGPSSNMLVSVDHAGTTITGVKGGGIASNWKYSNVSAQFITYLAYNNDGTVAATYHEFNGASSQWVVAFNHYDADGRVVETDTGVYAVSGMTVNAAANLVGALKEDFTAYDASGRKAETYTQYVDSSWAVLPTSGAKFDDTHFYYDAKGDLVQTTMQDGTQTQSVYDAMGRAVWKTDSFNPSNGAPNGTNTVYDSAGRVATTNQYDDVNITVTQDTGNPSFYDVSFTPPSSGHLLSTSSTTYDTASRPLTVVGTDGRDTVYAYNADGGATTTTSAGVSGQAASTTTASDAYQIAVLTAGGTIASGNTFTIQLVSGATNQSVVVTASGSSVSTLDNAIVTAWNGSGNSLFQGFTASYDADSQTVHVISKTQDAAWVTVNLSKSSGSSAFSDRLIHSTLNTDGLGKTTVTELDPLNRTYRVDYPDGSFTENLYGVNATAVSGFSDQSVVGHEQVSFDQLGNATDSYYDSLDRLTAVYQPAVADALNGGASTKPHWAYTYDPDGNELTQVDPKGNETVWTYDATGNQLSRSLPDSINGVGVPDGTETESWTYDYQKRAQTHKDFVGNMSLNVYDDSTATANGRESAQYRYAHSTLVPFSIPTPFNPESPGGNPNYTEKTTYTYDNLNRQTAVEDYAYLGTVPTQYTDYNYDESGGAVTINPSTGAMTSVSGDLAGYLTSEQTPVGKVHYVYDAVTGRLVETWTGTGSKSSATTDTLYGYDAQGRLASTTIVKQAGSTPSLTVSAIPYFDAVGDSITPATNWPTTVNTYDANGNVTKVAFPNGTETDTDYSSYWTTASGGVFGTETITNKRGTLTLSSFAYSFDADRRKIGDLETMTDVGESTSNTQKYTWVYDALSRLTSETYDYGNDDSPTTTTGHTTDDSTETYSFDLDGNRVTETLDISSDNGIGGGTNDQVIQSSYDKDNELTLEQTDNYNTLVISPITTTSALQYKNSTVYDANGSPTSLTHIDPTAGTLTTTYTSDLRNRMATVTSGGTTTTYGYDSDGNIVSQQAGAGTPTTYLWDRNDPTGYAQVLEVWTGGGTPASTYTIANSVIAQNVGSTVSFYLTDDQGTPRQLTAYTPSNSSTNGHVTGKYDYDAFGVAVTFRNSTHAPNTTNSSIGFQGEYVDPVTGNSVMGAREYVARTGRFWTMDDITLRAGDVSNADLFLFALADPINHSDPTGESGIDSNTGLPMGVVNGSAFSGDAFSLASELQNEEAAAVTNVTLRSGQLVHLAMASMQWEMNFLQVLQDNVAIDPMQALIGFIGARACFAAGTKILAATGADGDITLRDIENLRIGDYVMSRSESDRTAPLERRKVTSRIVSSSNHLRILTLQGTNGNVETIRTTDGHPFWLDGVGWKLAADLEIGQRIAGVHDDLVVAQSVREEHPNQIQTYNFEIDGAHTYFVDDGAGSPAAIWAHNACLASGETAATKGGRAVHDTFFAVMDALGYTTKTVIKGTRLIPDAFRIIYDKSGKAIGAVIHELKPDNVRAVGRGVKQLDKYATEIAKAYRIAKKDVVNIVKVIHTYT